MARQTVLLVDADPRSARVFEVSLRNAGYSVTHVQSAAEAVEAIEVAIPDLVISDTRLAPSKVPEGATPLTDGYSLCRRLKDDPVWYAIPFIFLTSSASIEDKIRGLELGVEDFLTKPIYLREIITRIQLVLAKKQREGMEGRTSRASFTGLLSEMGLVDLLSTIDLGRKSGVLELESPVSRGLVFFRDGRVVDAKVNKIAGANAVYRMLLWTDGRFEIRFGPCNANEVIEMSTQGLLMEGMRRIDEWQRMREQLPPLESVFEVDVPEVLARIGEIPDEINPILRAFDGKRTLIEVVDESGIDDLEALATLTKLYFEGLIVPARTSSGTTSDTRVALPDDRRRDTLIGFETDVESSLPSLPPAAAQDDDVMLPASTPESGVNSPATHGEGAASNRALTDASPSPNVSDGTGTAILPAPPSAPPDRGTSTSQEPAVAKQRGKNRRSKREFADSSAGKSTASTASSSVAPATASTAPVIDSEESDESDEAPAAAAKATPSVAPPAEASGAQPAVTEDAKPSQPAPSATVEAAKAEAPAADAAKSDDGKIEIASLMGAAKAEGDKKPEPASDAARADAPKAEENKTEGGTIIQFPRSARAEDAKVDEKKADDAKVEEKKAEDAKADEKKADEKKADEKKPDAKKADEKKADEKKADEKKADEKKADEKKSDRPADKKGDPKKDAKKPEGKRERKDSHGDLGDEAKAFFSDNSYEVAYKRTHDTFEDLKPEAHPEATSNRKLMYATVGLLVLIVGIVGGLAIYKKFWGVEDAQLSPGGLLLANNPGGSTTTPNANGSGTGTGNTTGGSTAGTNAEDSGIAAANAATEDSGVAVAAASTDDAAVATTTEDASAVANNTTSAEDAATTAANTAVEDSGVAATAANTTVEDSGIAATASNAAVTDSGVAAAPSGPAELLTAAQRAQGRGAAAAATAYQAYIDAGGNDGAAIARFAFWLANRGDLGRAGEWAERATQLDPNSQLGWYVLGAAKMEGPRRDAAAARAAFRRCASLPGRYAADCRAM